MTLLKVEGKAYNPNWIKLREAELNAMPSTTASDSEKWIKAYGRARLEEFCRHQAMMPDGRIVTRLPVCGTDQDKLADLGILADSYVHENRSESSGNNYTVILPEGWTMRPTDILEGDGQTPVDPLRNELWASVYNEADSRVIDVFYNSKPYGEGFRSRTRILEQ